MEEWWGTIETGYDPVGPERVVWGGRASRGPVDSSTRDTGIGTERGGDR